MRDWPVMDRIRVTCIFMALWGNPLLWIVIITAASVVRVGNLEDYMWWLGPMYVVIVALTQLFAILAIVGGYSIERIAYGVARVWPSLYRLLLLVPIVLPGVLLAATSGSNSPVWLYVLHASSLIFVVPAYTDMFLRDRAFERQRWEADRREFGAL